MSFELNKKLAAKREPLKTSAKVDPVTAGIIRGAFETVMKSSLLVGPMRRCN